MNTNFLSNYQKLESFKEKLEKDYEEKLNGLLNDFIDQLEVSPLHKIFILDFLEKMYQHSETTYKHSIDVAFRTYELGSNFAGGKSYMIRVQATGDNTIYLNSDLSEYYQTQSSSAPTKLISPVKAYVQNGLIYWSVV